MLLRERRPAGTGAAFVLGGVAQLELKHGTVQLWLMGSHLRRPAEELG